MFGFTSGTTVEAVKAPQAVLGPMKGPIRDMRVGDVRWTYHEHVLIADHDSRLWLWRDAQVFDQSGPPYNTKIERTARGFEVDLDHLTDRLVRQPLKRELHYVPVVGYVFRGERVPPEATP